jgi:protein ImuB
MPRIVSIWLPHWPIERLRRHNPDAVAPDQPIALVESNAQGLVITAVNGRAASQGVRIGATLADARAALPTLASRPAEPDRDQRALLKLARWVGRFGPSRNRDGSDGLWVDVTGVAHLFGGEDKLLADLVQRLQRFGVTARAGLADTYGAAHAMARFGVHDGNGDRNWAAIPPGEDRARLAHCPVDALRLAPATILLLRRLGLKRIGQLYDVPRVSLERRFATAYAAKKGLRSGSSRADAGLASAVLTRLDQALGLALEPLRPLSTPPVLEQRQTWSEPLMSADVLDNEMMRLAEALCTTLRAQGLGARHVGLALYRTDGSVVGVEARFSSASADAVHVMGLLREKLGGIDCGFGVDVAAIEALTAERLDATQVSLDRGGADQAARATATLIDRLTGRLGPCSVYRLDAQASHNPERANIRVAAQATMRVAVKANTRVATQIETSSATPERDPPRQRPALLITPPEPITIMAEVPEGIPRQFVWRRVHHRIVKGEGPERLEPEWWRWLATPGAPAHAANRARDYYRLEDNAGAMFWVFREGLYETFVDAAPSPSAPRWFMHGLMG